MQSKFPMALVAPNESALPPANGPAASAPATGLSAGFRAALGKKPAGFQDLDGKRKAELVRQAKSGGSALSAKPVQARPTHIGPRSGHK